jgi:DNA modification methylase
MENKDEQKESAGILRDRYIEPPFSILDDRGGNWRQRKNKWLELGIKSEEGRDAECLIGQSDSDYMPSMKSGVSIFDPALCELMYKWFCPDGGTIIDCFAGGSVRGIVAHKMGYKYTGIELRPEQVTANIEQGKEICAGNEPKWICGDSNQVLDTINEQFDMIFSCPPYADLEVYSNDKDDLSNMPYDKFLHLYRSIILKTVEKLKTGGFAVFVVGDVRDKDGYYYDFISDTKKAFIVAGAKLYNEAILLDPIGTAMIRANNFAGSRKLVKVHQNILVFKKAGEINEELKQKVKTGYELSKKCPKCGSPTGIKKLKEKKKDFEFVCQDCCEYVKKEELDGGLFD